MESPNHSELRLVAVFLMGLSVGICAMLVYMTARGPAPAVQRPAAGAPAK